MADAGRDSARNQILSRIRKQLGVRGDEPGRRGRVRDSLANPRANLIPERAKKTRPELVKLFQTMLEKSGAKVSRVRSLKNLGEAVSEALREHNLPLRLRAGTDPIFSSLRETPGLLEILSGPAEAGDAVSLSHAVAAAAESGTLFLASGPENPSTLNFLPEAHMIIVRADDIAGSYEECWVRIRSLYGAGRMPRTVNLVSGPSRTADIEQTIVMGAHGPKKLIVFIAG